MKVNIGPYPDGEGDRTVEVQIDEFDTWNMDATLARIIYPMLLQLKATKHGSPLVDDEDVPENIRSTADTDPREEWDTDKFLHDRWDYVLDQMIWSFKQIYLGRDGTIFYYRKSRWKKLTDQERRGKAEAYEDRIENGTRLFGKYFRGLWD